MADGAKTSENARSCRRTARAHPIFDICDLILRWNFLKLQILSPWLPWSLGLNFENLMNSPFNTSWNLKKKQTWLKMLYFFFGGHIPHPNPAKWNNRQQPWHLQNLCTKRLAPKRAKFKKKFLVRGKAHPWNTIPAQTRPLGPRCGLLAELFLTRRNIPFKN